MRERYRQRERESGRDEERRKETDILRQRQVYRTGDRKGKMRYRNRSGNLRKLCARIPHTQHTEHRNAVLSMMINRVSYRF